MTMTTTEEPDPILNYLSMILDEKFKNKELTQDELAEKSGVSRPTISNLRAYHEKDSDRKGMSFAMLQKILKALGKTLAEIEVEAEAWAREQIEREEAERIKRKAIAQRAKKATEPTENMTTALAFAAKDTEVTDELRSALLGFAASLKNDLRMSTWLIVIEDAVRTLT